MTHLLEQGAPPEARPDMPPPFTKEISADLCCEQALNALDELAAMAAKHDTAHHVIANRIFVGQIVGRAQTLARLMIAKETPTFKMVSNNG